MSTRQAVLIVEDDTDVRELLVRRFTRCGYRAVAVASGEAGLAALEERRPCLAVVDIGLPGMSGWEFIKRMRASTTGNIPVCVVSALDRPAGPDGLIVDQYVIKPFTVDDIEGMLNVIDKEGS